MRLRRRSSHCTAMVSGGADSARRSEAEEEAMSSSPSALSRTSRRPQHLSTQLHFVRVSAITPHEEYAPSHEAGVGPLIERDGVLRNPLIVAEIAPGHYTLLDGTHRLEYLRRAGLAWALVQVVALDDPTAVA